MAGITNDVAKALNTLSASRFNTKDQEALREFALDFFVDSPMQDYSGK